MSVVEETIELRHVPHANTILLGYEIGHADLPNGRRLSVVAAGKIVRFHISGIDGYVDIDLNPLASAAAAMLEESISDS